MTMAAADSDADAADMYARADALGVRCSCAQKGQCEKRRDKCFHRTLHCQNRTVSVLRPRTPGSNQPSIQIDTEMVMPV
jgi:hypothetical protein